MIKLWLPFLVIGGFTAATIQTGPVRWGNFGREVRMQSKRDIVELQLQMRDFGYKAHVAEDSLKRMWRDMRHHG